MVINKDSFSIPYAYKFYCTSKEEFSETSETVSKYGFDVDDSQAMEAIGNKSNQSPSNRDSDQEGNERETQGRDD